MIPRRKNSQTISAEWFNSIADEVSMFEQEYELENNEVPTSLEYQSFDGAEVSSVYYEYEVQRGTTVFANGRFFLQNLNGTWRLADNGFVGEEHGVTFDFDQVGLVADLIISTDGLGTGSLKLKRKVFSV